MSKITRRNLLTGIAGCSMAAALGGCQKVTRKSAHAVNDSIGTITKLNVFIHGLSVIQVKPTAADGLWISFPDFVDPRNPQLSHVYGFNSLVQVSDKNHLLTFDAQNPCFLNGVQSGKRPTAQDFGEPAAGIGGSGQPDINLMFPSNTAVATGQRKFVLPWPDKIYCLNLMYRNDLKTLLKPGQQFPVGPPLFLPTIYLLTYVVPSGTPTVLYNNTTNSGWVPKTSLDPAYANLHIYGEPNQTGIPSSHAVMAFKTMAQMLTDATGTTLDNYYIFDDYGMANAKPQALPNPTIPQGVAVSLELGQLASSRAGEVANCVSGIIIQ